MLISRRVEDPGFLIPGNRAGRTSGFYGHTNKYWSCKDTDFFASSPYDEFMGEQKAHELKLKNYYAHKDCKWPYRHKSAHGYLSLITSKFKLVFYYGGNPYRGKLFELHKGDFRFVSKLNRLV